MRQALGIIYGSNIGTTMTGWLVAIIGYKINVETFALPMIGVGMLVHLTGGESKRGPFGMVLVGFGLFFIGIGVLKDAFDGLLTVIDLNQFTLDGIGGVLMYVGVGFLMTVLTQSSSAAIALTLTAATGGVVGLYAAAAMVIGANVGTTSTAGIAVIGATANAKRVACAHIIFNVGTGVVALMILPILFWVVQNTGELLGLEAIPALTLALFHTVFNVLGVALIFPLNNRLACFLEKRFITQDEIESRPIYLDKTIAVSPALSINALALELSRITAVVRRMGLAAMSSEFTNSRKITSDNRVVHKLCGAVAAFITRLERKSLTNEVSEQLANILRAEQHLLACADQASAIAKAQANIVGMNDEVSMANISRFRAEVVDLMIRADPTEAGFSFEECGLQLDQVQGVYDEVKAALLLAGVELRVPIPVMIDVIDQNSRIRRMTRQMVKAMRYLNEVFVTAEILTPGLKLKREQESSITEGKRKPLNSMGSDSIDF